MGPKGKGKATKGPSVQPLRSAQTSAGPQLVKKRKSKDEAELYDNLGSPKRLKVEGSFLDKACEDYIASGHGQLVWPLSEIFDNWQNIPEGEIRTYIGNIFQSRFFRDLGTHPTAAGEEAEAMLEVYKVIRNELHSIGFNPSHPLVSSTFDRLDVQRSTLGEDNFSLLSSSDRLKIFCLAALTSSEPPVLPIDSKRFNDSDVTESSAATIRGNALESPVKHLNIQESAITSQKSTSPPQKAEPAAARSPSQSRRLPRRSKSKAQDARR